MAASVEAQISLIKLEFSSCLFADSLMNLLRMFHYAISIIASASSSSEYSWSESRLKSSDLNSSRLRVLKCLLNDRNSRSVGFVSKKGKNMARKSNISASIPDDRYTVSNGSGYAVLIFWNEYAILDRKLDTPYLMEVDTSYSTVDQNSVVKINNLNA
ncbi:hypothetical protein Tco_0704903 [Tanacetum coccineum]|uniref:Uncharacterized protein n=1 Tax=Tanacetum coccineum TaxID=301880 RepID=A0ABQ4Y3U2_9ASTR